MQTPLLLSLVKLRTRNHRLPIETGNWNRTPINERVCVNCNQLGDEYHFLLKCPMFDHERKTFIKRYYVRNTNTFKLEQLMNTTNKVELFKLSKMCKTILMRTR